MAKAVLIMDMPESCFGCNLCHIDYEEERATCQAYETVKEVNSGTFKKPNWCPLRELPEKKKLTYADLGTENKVNGWNDAMDFIFPEEKKKRKEERIKKNISIVK